MSSKIGIGKGLDVVMRGLKENNTPEKSIIMITNLRQLDIKTILPSKYQPREIFDDESLNELADSIRSYGVVQPVLVRPSSDQNYEIVAGERRWRAAQLAGLDKIPVIVSSNLSDKDVLACAIIENIQRKNLNALEEAEALQKLINEFEMTHEATAKAVGRSRVAVSNLLRLLDLHKRVKENLRREKITMGHARAILALDQEKQYVACQKVLAENLSVRKTEDLVKKMLFSKNEDQRDNNVIFVEDIRLRKLSEDFNQVCHSEVKIKLNNSNGKIRVEFESIEQLENLFRIIKKNIEIQDES